MEQEESTISVPVLWRGKKYVVDINSEASVKEFGDEVQKLTNVKADTMKLIVPQSSGKTSTLLEPFSTERSFIWLKDTEILKAKSIRMMGVLKNEVDEVLKSAKDNSRIVGFEEEEKRMRQRMSYGHLSYPKLPEGPYVFCGFKTLEIPGIELNPPPSEALKRLHMLAADPGIVAIMNKHRWRVGIMTELAPVGYVGVSPKCILGFNKNQGEEISLRLRTDDLKGFRKYESIKKTLLHELAHMVYSEHDANFKALDSQLNQEAIALDWTSSGGHTLSGVSSRDYDDVDAMFQSETSGSHRLGGEAANTSAGARAASVAAAYHRLAEANSVTSKEGEEPDPDDSGPKTKEMANVMEAENETTVIMDNPVEKKFPLDREPDPDESLQDHVKFEPDPDYSATGEYMEFEPSHREGITKVEPDPDDTEMSGVLRSVTARETLVGKRHEEPDPDDFEASKFQLDEPDPDDKVDRSLEISKVPSVQADEDNGELQRIQDPVAVFCDRLTKAIEMLRAEVNPTDGALVLQTLFKIIRNLLENPSEMKYRRLRKANPVFQKSVANHKAAMEVLFLVGFSEDVVFDEIGKAETYLVLKRDDPGLLWLAKSSLEMRIS